MASRILVALKGTTVDDAVMVRAGELARAMDAALVLLHVVHPDALDASGVRKDEAAQRLEAHAATIRSHGMEAETMVVEGEPWEEVCAVAENGSFSLLVLGKHAHTEVRDIVAGSETDRLIRRCRISVVLVDSRHP